MNFFITKMGSSGSSIFNYNNKVIDIHYVSYKKNQRIEIVIKFPIDEFIQIYNKKDVNKIIDDNLLDEFNKKQYVNIKYNNVDILDLSRKCLGIN